MDLLTIIRVVLRRWYVSAPILLLSLGVAAYVQSTVPSEYEARGSVLLEQPSFDPSTRLNAQSVVGLLDTAGSLEMAIGDDVTLVPRARDVSTIEFAAAGPDAGAVENAVRIALQQTGTEIDALQEQAEVAEPERVVARVLTPNVTAEELADGTFQAFGTLLLLDPNMGRENPYLVGGGTTSILLAAVSSDGGRIRVAERAPDVTFAVSTSRDAPHIVGVTTVGPDAELVLRAFDVVRDVMNEELDERQAGANVSPARRIVVTDLAVPHFVSDISPPLDRSVAAIVGVGGLLAVVVAVALESLLTRRRQRADDPSEPEPVAIEEMRSLRFRVHDRLERSHTVDESFVPREGRAKTGPARAGSEGT